MLSRIHNHRSKGQWDVNRVFLLSPANPSGARARLVMNERAEFERAIRLRREGAPLGDLFGFMSGLYFRGKSAYSCAFATPPPGVSGSLVITDGRGLLPQETLIRFADLLEIAAVPTRLPQPANPEHP